MYLHMKDFFSNLYVQIGLGLVIIVAISYGAVVILSRHPATYATATATRRDLSGDHRRNRYGSRCINDVSLSFNIS